MRRVVARIFALSVGLLSFGESTDSAGLTLGVESAGADETANDCVGFRKTDGVKSLVFEASSSCDQKLKCSLSWVLTCSTDKGQVTHRSPQSRHFTLDAQGSAEQTASADSCKQSWRIDDVRWTCNDAK